MKAKLLFIRNLFSVAISISCVFEMFRCILWSIMDIFGMIGLCVLGCVTYRVICAVIFQEIDCNSHIYQ